MIPSAGLAGAIANRSSRPAGLALPPRRAPRLPGSFPRGEFPGSHEPLSSPQRGGGFGPRALPPPLRYSRRPFWRLARDEARFPSMSGGRRGGDTRVAWGRAVLPLPRPIRSFEPCRNEADRRSCHAHKAHQRQRCDNKPDEGVRRCQLLMVVARFVHSSVVSRAMERFHPSSQPGRHRRRCRRTSDPK